MTVTGCPRERPVPYRTRLTGWLISMNEGFGAARWTPRHFTSGFIGLFEVGDNTRDNNPLRPWRVPFDPKRTLKGPAIGGSHGAKGDFSSSVLGDIIADSAALSNG
jgi:hypothetical protein